MPSNRTVTVVGSITKDFIWRQGEKVRMSLGGILYNTIALSALMPNAVVVPVANVGRDIFDDCIKLLSRFANVSLDGIRQVDKQNPRCYLNFVSGKHFNDGSVVPVTLANLKKFLSADIIMMTFPTGHEMTLRSFESVRRKTNCPIYVDYHMLAHGGDQAGFSSGKGLRQWRNWIRAADFAQFNHFEAEHLFGESIETKSDVLSFGRELTKKRTKAIVVTWGEKGSFVIHPRDGGLGCDHIASVKCAVVIDTVGSGDVYSAGFIAQYLRSQDVLAAARFGSRAAAQRCGAHDLMELFELLRKLV
ncbi:MAG TPA: PfkB family carbohydrate kinase [Thermoproteota archaeon]|nr:PfkB family carbohydrate kinase [Thermoproteota archaeon]